MTHPFQIARVREAAMRDPVVRESKANIGAELDAYMRRKGPKPFADGLTALQHVQSLHTPEFIAKANAEWAAIPTDPAELSAWMRREPLNPVTPEE